MRFRIYSALLLIAVSVIASCSKNTNPKPSPTPTPPKTDSLQTTPIWSTDADVYFVGTSGQNIPTYWKNGVATVLSSGNDATGIAVSGGDVYVVGQASGGAAYWKNGLFISLKVSQVTTQALAITISGSDVYIAGEIDGKAAYWKNGVATTVDPDQLFGSIANAITVSGNDVYLAGGTYSVSGAMQAAYWKNGTLTQLSPTPLPVASTEATGIAVSGSDVYVTGYTNDGATLWKNGTASALTNVNTSLANAIMINGSNVYVSGFMNAKVICWKNGTAINLPANDGNLINEAYFALDGNDLYVAGGLSTSPEGSVYWRNGVAYLFSKDIENIKGIFIAPH
jgi:hypothetical protein